MHRWGFFCYATFFDCCEIPKPLSLALPFPRIDVCVRPNRHKNKMIVSLLMAERTPIESLVPEFEFATLLTNHEDYAVLRLLKVSTSFSPKVYASLLVKQMAIQIRLLNDALHNLANLLPLVSQSLDALHKRFCEERLVLPGHRYVPKTSS